MKVKLSKYAKMSGRRSKRMTEKIIENAKKE